MTADGNGRAAARPPLGRPRGPRGGEERAPMPADGNGRAATRPHFGDRLATAVARRESQIVLGIDPDPVRLWPGAVEGSSEARAHLASTLSEAEDAAGGVREASGAPAEAGVVARLEAAAAVLAHCLALIDAAGPAC